MDPLLEIAGLDAGYMPGINVLKDVSLTVHTGEIVALLGRNGAGKSTLIRCVGGHLRPSSGTVRFAGVDISGAEPDSVIKCGIATVPEGRRVFSSLSVQENLAVGMFSRRKGITIKADLSRIFDLFPRLAERRSQAAGTLSGGEQQMVAMGRALMAEPKMLLLDEPSMGLAPMMIESVFDMINRLAKDGVTILLVEQNAVAALDIADRAYVLERGGGRAVGPGRRSREQIRNPVALPRRRAALTAISLFNFKLTHQRWQMQKRTWLNLASGALVSAVALGVASAGAKEIKVGFFCPLSGAVAVYGNDSLKAAQFALEEIAQKKFLGANTIKLIPADTAGNPAQAAQSVQRMIDADEVMAVFGGCTSPETAAAVEISEPAKIPLLSHLAQDTSLTQKGNKWFIRISQTAKVFSSNAAEWSINRQKAKSIYILARNDNYGQSLADAFEEKAKAMGATIAGRVAYEPNGKEFKPILARMGDAKPDFVSILGFYTDTALIVKQMAELQIKLPTFANTSPALSQFREIAGPASNGAYGALYYYAGSIESEQGKDFIKNWQAKFGRLPTQYEAMGYDGLYVLAEAIKRADAAGKLTSEGIRDALLATKDYAGATGAITILPNGDVQRPLPFVQLVDGEMKLDYLMK